MLRLKNIMRMYSLDKESMLRRRNCFYSENGDGYSNDSIKYAYNLTLDPGSHYKGVADICFKLQKTDNIFLDFQGQEIKRMAINGKEVDASSLHKEGRIHLSKDTLKVGDNNVCVEYHNAYDKDGSGCVSFIDVDKKQYLYTQFEPYMGNRVFPMFDQPDLKAKMKLAIASPAEWETVLSNENEEPTEKKKSFGSVSPVCSLTQKIIQDFQSKLPEGYKINSFPETKLLPTYLFCFVVGPYKRYISNNTYKGLPMSLYCIESLYPYMMKLVPFIEEMTNKSMEFFEKYFGYPYPFNKYDQVFAHEYKWGAMENAGIVTLNDLYIFKDPVSTEKMIGFGNTIIHEMAHHWFGNLVTMKWWDDLWLNESFAEYISHYCLEKIKNDVKTINYESAMASFLNRKGWGYAEDELVTTHPIRTEVQNTLVAESIFDGITYSKGAATMKQLMYLMGEENFSKALKEYFHSFQFKNAELSDLLKYMSKFYVSKGNLTIDQWREMWLEKAGLNILEHEVDVEKSVLRIKQSCYHSNHQTLRSHTIKVALVKGHNKIEFFEVTVNPQEVTEVPLPQQLLNKFLRCEAVLLNYDDLTFAKVVIDQKSILYFKNNLNKIEDVLFRSMVWKNFYDMVRGGMLKSTDYIEILVNNLFGEKSDAILEENLNYALTVIEKYTPKNYRAELLDKMVEECLKERISLHENRGIIVRDKLISFCNRTNSKHMKLIYDWYYENDSKEIITNLGALNNTERWKIVIKVISSNVVTKADKLLLLQDMISRDNSDTMKNKKLTCEALLMDEEKISDFLESLFTKDPKELSMTSLIHYLSGINNKIHENFLRGAFKEEYFNILRTVVSGSNHSHNLLTKSEMIETFIDYLDLNIEDTVEDLEYKIKNYEAIQQFNNDKIRIQILKKVDLLKKRVKCFKLYDL